MPEDQHKVEMSDKKEGEAYYGSTVSYLKDFRPGVFGIHNFSDFRKVKQCILPAYYKISPAGSGIAPHKHIIYTAKHLNIYTT